MHLTKTSSYLSLLLICTMLLVSLPHHAHAQRNKYPIIQLNTLTAHQRWIAAEESQLYIVACGISYAKFRGENTEKFGIWTGKIAFPFYKPSDSLTPTLFLQAMFTNLQQFHGFKLKILDTNPACIKGRLKNFGNHFFTLCNMGVTEDEYIRFFYKKWETIAKHISLVYKQERHGDWLNFTITKKE